MASKIINLIASWSSLLSGGLDDCYSIDEEWCRGGIASVTAFARNLSQDSPTLIIPGLDKQSQFVQVHPLGWTVNRLVFNQHFGFNLFVSTPSLLLQNAEDFGVSSHDISDLQTHDMPLLLTNVKIPPSTSWHEYTNFVHFDAATGIALISIGTDGEPLTWSQIDSAVGALNYIEDQNIRSGCSKNNQRNSATMTLYDQYLLDHSEDSGNIFRSSSESGKNECWIPVVYYMQYNTVNFKNFIATITEHKNYPALIMDVSGNYENYASPTQVGSNGVWVVSSSIGGNTYHHLQLTLRNGDDDTYNQLEVSGNEDAEISVSSSSNIVQNVTLIQRDLRELPVGMKDDIYASDIRYLRRLADEAKQNDPVVGMSSYMPVARVDTYRRCKGGECEIGNLFTDSLRWKANSDVAFVTSGGLRGTGWDEGEVRVSNIWESLPFPNTMCTGVMSGVSLFRLLDYSIRTATFESEETRDGGRLLQISGMKVTYNTRYQGGDEHRVLSIDVWDKDLEIFQPIERLKLYEFATDSFLCGAYDPYPDLLGANGNFNIHGEQPGVIGDTLQQNIVGEYLADQEYYVAGIEGRLVNTTDNNTLPALDLVQSERSCLNGTYWIAEEQRCASCPNSDHVNFLDERVEFFSVQGNITQHEGRVLLINRDQFDFSVVPRTVPSWVTLRALITSSDEIQNGEYPNQVDNNQSSSIINDSTNSSIDSSSSSSSNNISAISNVTDIFATPILMRPGDTIEVNFLVRDPSVVAGTALGTVSFGILGDTGSFLECAGHSQDATFDIFVTIAPNDHLNQLGVIRIAGIVLMGIIFSVTGGFAVWVILRQKSVRIVKVMQPVFLVTICCGVIIASAAIISLSIDDGIASVHGCNIACMATPWLVSTGLTIVFSALFSKLWRINRLLGGTSIRRVTVTVRDVIGPFIILFVVNFTLLLVWTLVDPYHWERRSVSGEQWNTYGICTTNGIVGRVLMILTCLVNVSALGLACAEAYKARNISSEFSEGKYLYLALYICAQILVVAGPVLLLLDEDNITAIYFLSVGVIFTCAMTMTSTVVVPILRHIWKANNANDNDFSASTRDPSRRETHMSRMSGTQ